MKNVTMLLVFLSIIVSAKSIVFSDETAIFSMKGMITNELANDFVQKVLTYDKEEMFIYIDSPGGSVGAMFKIIDVMDVSDVKFTCIARNAYSAAHAILQVCDTRLMTSNGFLMAHQAKIALKGNLHSIRRILNMLISRITVLDKRIAKRSGMPYARYDRLIAKDLWMSSRYAKKINHVDTILDNLSCTKELAKKKIKITLYSSSVFGVTAVDRQISACPLIDKVEDVEQ